MSDLREITLILTTLEKRGEGTKSDPVRRVYQLWTHDGKVVAEYDPLKGDSGQFQPQALGERP